jgi:hypothetical protein
MYSRKSDRNQALLKLRFPINSIYSYYEARQHVITGEQQLKSKLADLIKLNEQKPEKEKLISEFRLSILDLVRPLKAKITQSMSEKIRSHAINLKNKRKSYELFKILDYTNLRKDRLPAKGITLLPFKFHKQKVDTAQTEEEKLGEDVHPLIYNLVIKKYPQFKNVIYEYCRPMATSNAVFEDFNREQISSPPSTKERLDDILELINYYLNPTPYRPVHYNDYIYCRQPLVTGTGYYNKRSFDAKSHAKYSHPELYKDYPLSKGFFINYTFLAGRPIIHNIKHTGTPFKVLHYPKNEKAWQYIGRELSQFFLSRPTSLYVRVHISKRDAELKIRPVYGVDDIFLIIETMLTFPLLVQARDQNCAIMHSLETLRGSNWEIDKQAQGYNSFFTLDYSRYDQSIPFSISDTYFTEFLPRLIIVNKDYQETYATQPGSVQPDVSSRYIKMKNLLGFYHTWFRNMTFLTPEGYAYKRQHAGIASGMLNTQQLDSYCNLYLICDALLEYGLSKDQIKQIKMFVLGDDNVGFTYYNIYELQKIFEFVIPYLKDRWNMIIKPEKCVFTDNRQNISTLSYECSFGHPKKDINKLCAHLFYPEHGTKIKYMASRAVGMAYAACGISKNFHNLCEDVYNLFLEYAEQPNINEIDRKGKFLPGVFHALEDKDKFTDITHFPTIEEVLDQVIKWHGPLDFKNKWNTEHFVNPPNHQEEDIITMFDYAQQIGDKLIIPPFLM